jgi:hypothetical protein
VRWFLGTSVPWFLGIRLPGSPEEPRNRGTEEPRAILAALATFLLFGCATPRPPDAKPVPAVVATDAAAEWEQLVQKRREFTGAQSYVRMRVVARGRTDSFKAQLAVDAAGHALITGYTPLGTTAFSLYDDGESVLFLDHISRAWWRGAAEQLQQIVETPVSAIRPVDLAFLMIGLPASVPAVESLPPATLPCPSGGCSEPAGAILRSDGRISYLVTARGLAAAAVRRGLNVVRSDFDPPSYPPLHLVIRRFDESGTVQEEIDLQHLDLVSTAEPIKPPEVPSGYAMAVGSRQ